MSDSQQSIRFFDRLPPIADLLGSSTSLVEYRSAGHCLLVGDVDTAAAIAARLDNLTVTVLVIDPERKRLEKRLTDTGLVVLVSPRPRLLGYLGAFQCLLDGDGVQNLALVRPTDSGYFDLVLDLSAEPLIQIGLPPFGYFAPRDEPALELALQTLPGLVGEFEKPRYFAYDESRCAHQRSRIQGCRRCIDICVTGAISSNGEGVSVDPFLCQGCGSCATVCPSGAMTYAYPRPADAITRSREQLLNYRRQHGWTDGIVLLLYRQHDDTDVDRQFEQRLPSGVVPLAVEEVSGFGIDYWAAMLASGCSRIIVLVTEDEQDPNNSALREQAALLDELLTALHWPDAGVVLATATTLESVLAMPATMAASVSATFTTHNDKRQTLRMAIDHLVSAADAIPEPVSLPTGSPFGRVLVNTDRCTLCMACVSVCPAGALLDGQDLPKLRFIESNCVQCGICRQACPESAITLAPRFEFDSQRAREARVLQQEEPFHCIRCHKAFATRRIIDAMTLKLSGHWMFADEKARRRLQMCEDCRVVDMFEADAGGIRVHRDS